MCQNENLWSKGLNSGCFNDKKVFLKTLCENERMLAESIVSFLYKVSILAKEVLTNLSIILLSEDVFHRETQYSNDLAKLFF